MPVVPSSPQLLGYANPAAVAKRTMWLLKARDPQLVETYFTGEQPPKAVWARSGRGAGKTRLACEWVVDKARRYPGTRWHYVAPTHSDLRAVVFEGESGLLAVIDVSELMGGTEESGYNKSTHVITLSNGSIIQGFSAETPKRLRGPQCHGGVLEEISSWPKETAVMTLEMFEYGLRLPMPDGTPTQYVISSTPENNVITRTLMQDEDVHVVTESTFENQENLDPAFMRRMEKKKGTRLGRQELYGEVLTDAEGSMWKSDWLRHIRVTETTVVAAMSCAEFEEHGGIQSVRVGWDPAVTKKRSSDQHGIVAALRFNDGDLCVLADRSDILSPVQAARRCIALALEVGAPRIIMEDNQGKLTWTSVWKEAGGDDTNITLEFVSATSSKEARAIPLATKYEEAHNGDDSSDMTVWHLRLGPASREIEVDSLEELETEMTGWVPSESPKSPNRIDALVWAAHGLGVRISKKSNGVYRAGRLSEVQ